MKGTAKQSKWGKWRTILFVAIVVVVAGAAGVGLRWWQEQGSAPEPLAKLPEVVNEVQKLRVGGDAEAADKKINEALADPSLDDTLRSDLYIQQGHSFVDKQEYQKAIEAYKMADQLNPTHWVSWLLGDIYRRINDNEQAIVYYKMTIERIPADEPLAEADREHLQAVVKELEAAQQ